MRKITLLTFLLFFISVVQAQKKKDLLLQVESLQSKYDSIQALLAESERNERVSTAKVAATQEQLEDLKKTNASLLSNLNNFAEVSKKKSDNVSKTLESLREKEQQLKVINDALSDGDSIKLATLTLFKNAIGEEAGIALSNATIIIKIPNTLLFGDNDKNYLVEEKAKSLLERIAAVLNANPDMKITVEGNSNALEFKDKTLLDNWDLSARQAASVTRMLQNDFQIDPQRMEALGKSQYATETVDTATRIIINPKFDEFYALVREHMKGGN